MTTIDELCARVRDARGLWDPDLELLAADVRRAIESERARSRELEAVLRSLRRGHSLAAGCQAAIGGRCTRGASSESRRIDAALGVTDLAGLGEHESDGLE